MDIMEKRKLRLIVHKHGGVLSNKSDHFLDGKEYEYEAIFNSDEEIEDCLLELNASKSDSTYIEGYLTCFFSLSVID